MKFSNFLSSVLVYRLFLLLIPLYLVSSIFSSSCEGQEINVNNYITHFFFPVPSFSFFLSCIVWFIILFTFTTLNDVFETVFLEQPTSYSVSCLPAMQCKGPLPFLAPSWDKIAQLKSSRASSSYLEGNARSKQSLAYNIWPSLLLSP